MTFVLFYLGSTFSYVSMKFYMVWDLDFEYLKASMYVSKPVRLPVCVDQVYHVCFDIYGI